MARDDAEFTRLFREHYAGLCRFLECMTGGRSLAQDLTQECFLRLHRAPDVPCDEARFWLYRVARNLALNELSKGRTRRRLYERVVEALRPRAVSPEESYERHEQVSVLDEALRTLPEHQRATLLLREMEEMSYREIALVLRVSEGKVKIDLFRARGALRERWAEASRCGGRLRESESEGSC